MREAFSLMAMQQLRVPLQRQAAARRAPVGAKNSAVWFTDSPGTRMHKTVAQENDLLRERVSPERC